MHLLRGGYSWVPLLLSLASVTVSQGEGTHLARSQEGKGWDGQDPVTEEEVADIHLIRHIGGELSGQPYAVEPTPPFGPR